MNNLLKSLVFITLLVLCSVAAHAETLQPMSSGDTGMSSDGRTYTLRWKTLSAARDRPRNPPYPDPVPLMLHGDDIPLEIDRVWAGHPVGFCLYTLGTLQHVVYYNADRQMIIAQRTLGERTWKKYTLPSQIDHAPRTGKPESSTILGWDSHNYITLFADADGYLHLSGNMHVNKLTYFRQTRRGDITSFVQEPMTGQQEDRCTYPKFLLGPDKQLVFHYRYGSSGSGIEIYNQYNAKTNTWGRLLDTPLIDGEGKRNAYMTGPLAGPDGMYHMIWVWRDTPDCSTNHDLSYARSPDLKHWQTITGAELKLPITFTTQGVFVDPTPTGGGLLNSCKQLRFDSKHRPVLSYHKYDADGNSQIFNARYDSGQWNIVQATNWNYRWNFSGGGSIVSEISIGGVKVHKPGVLYQTYTHIQNGPGRILLNEETLKPLPN